MDVKFRDVLAGRTRGPWKPQRDGLLDDDIWNISRHILAAVIKEFFVLRFSAGSEPINSVSDYKHEKDNRDQVATPLFSKSFFEAIGGHYSFSRFGFAISSTMRSNASRLSSAPSSRAASLNRSDCFLSLIFGVRFCFSPTFPIRPLSDQ